MDNRYYVHISHSKIKCNYNKTKGALETDGVSSILAAPNHGGNDG